MAHQTYPRSISAINNLSVCYAKIGQFDAALDANTEVLKLDPRYVPALANRADLLMRLGRFDEAKNSINTMLAQKMDRASVHEYLYQLGLIQNEPALMQQQLEWATNKQEELRALDWQAQTAIFRGKLREATQHYQRAMEIVKQRQQPDQLAALMITLANAQAAFGLESEAQPWLRNAIDLSQNTFVRYAASTPTLLGTFTLALSNDNAQAELLMTETLEKYPKNTLANNLWIPVTHATIQLKQLQPAKTVEVLRAALPFEQAGAFVPTWLRGQAFLQLNKGREAAGEFQKIIANRGWQPTSPFYPLARLGLARAYAQLGDSVESRNHYMEFFKLWKDADTDLPVLSSAKKEYAALR